MKHYCLCDSQISRSNAQLFVRSVYGLDGFEWLCWPQRWLLDLVKYWPLSLSLRFWAPHRWLSMVTSTSWKLSFDNVQSTNSPFDEFSVQTDFDKIATYGHLHELSLNHVFVASQSRSPNYCRVCFVTKLKRIDSWGKQSSFVAQRKCIIQIHT